MLEETRQSAPGSARRRAQLRQCKRLQGWERGGCPCVFEHQCRFPVLAGTPSVEGCVRYPPSGYYDANETPGTPCTCCPACPQDCKGLCGCEACHEAYVDFLSGE